MRMLALLALTFSLAACAEARDPDMPATVNGDVASYDAMRQAAQACAAGGGHLELRRGGSTESVSDYLCRQGATR